MTFDYLGSRLSSKGDLTDDAKRNINKAAVISAYGGAYGETEQSARIAKLAYTRLVSGQS